MILDALHLRPVQGEIDFNLQKADVAFRGRGRRRRPLAPAAGRGAVAAGAGLLGRAVTIRRRSRSAERTVRRGIDLLWNIGLSLWPDFASNWFDFPLQRSEAQVWQNEEETCEGNECKETRDVTTVLDPEKGKRGARGFGNHRRGAKRFGQKVTIFGLEPKSGSPCLPFLVLFDLSVLSRTLNIATDPFLAKQIKKESQYATRDRPRRSRRQQPGRWRPRRALGAPRPRGRHSRRPLPPSCCRPQECGAQPRVVHKVVFGCPFCRELDVCR